MQDARKALDELPLCACFNLRKAARAVTGMYDEAMQASGLRGTQFSILAAVYAVERMPMTRLSEVLVMDRTTLSRNLKPLTRDGLIALREGEDRRVKNVILTAKGKRLVERALPRWREAQAKIVGDIGQDGLQRLLAMLHDVTRAAQG